ncbi:hypothetical protein [Micromonospora sp. NPDC126480]|uniref:hypothetical protein n=1 Tax=Micromonospora sp. NPDC126480 TaxID=3155312 RepID=UPI003322A075
MTIATWMRVAVGGAFALVVAAALVWRWHEVATVEAWLNARLVRMLGVAETSSIGAAVVFPLEQRWVGFVVSTGCSVAVLLIPPVVLASLFVAFGRLRPLRAVLSVGAALVLLVVINQARLAAVVVSMQTWGFEEGYRRSHVLIGSAITMVGLIAVAIVFAVLVGRASRPGPVAHAC